jgi:hypothetical protein
MASCGRLNGKATRSDDYVRTTVSPGECSLPGGHQHAVPDSACAMRSSPWGRALVLALVELNVARPAVKITGSDVGGLDQLDAIVVRIADEAEARAVLGTV